MKSPAYLPMFRILPHLYLSKFPDIIPSGITHVLNMCVHPHPDDTTRSYLHIPLDDVDNIAPEIPKIIKFIDEALTNGGTVLVHCAIGLNRSAAAVVSYLCNLYKINASEALKLLKERKADV